MLSTTNSRRAAQHFMALTLLLAADVTRNAADENPDIDASLVDGVDALLRAYRRSG